MRIERHVNARGKEHARILIDVAPGISEVVATLYAGRGRPRLDITDEERRIRRREQFTKANRKRRQPKP